tara:strand:- start:1137 stop:1439 length:303 start_codon:yes stop_codon:yes gene_type:complete
MSALINFSIDVKSLPKQKFQQHANGKIYLSLTMAINDETRFGNNASVYVYQDQEEREAKKQRVYLGNGKVVWTDNKISLAERKDEAQKVPQKKEVADLPF